MDALIAKARYNFHKNLFETNTIALTTAGIASNADTSSRSSKAISRRIIDILEKEQHHTVSIVNKVSGQTLGKQFEKLTMEFLNETFPQLQNLRPGKWTILQLGNRENNQVSFEMYINDTYKKTLLLSAASYFESIITNAIHNYAREVTKQNDEIVSFIDNKAINRQFHTYFDWDKNNANQFFKLFGDGFKEKARKQIKANQLEEAERVFIAIGHERNCLVHQNFIEHPINDTFEEIYEKYQTGCVFIEFIVQLLSA